MEKLKVILTSPESKVPLRGTEGSAGYDICSVSDGNVDPNSRSLIDSGIIVEIPKGYMGLIAARSSMALKGIDIGGGIIDSDYRGKLGIILINSTDDVFQFRKGDRIAQLILIPISTPDVVEAKHLNSTSRNGGFGSTGV